MANTADVETDLTPRRKATVQCGVELAYAIQSGVPDGAPFCASARPPARSPKLGEPASSVVMEHVEDPQTIFRLAGVDRGDKDRVPPAVGTSSSARASRYVR